jgi:hypothetical protein
VHFHSLTRGLRCMARRVEVVVVQVTVKVLISHHWLISRKPA